MPNTVTRMTASDLTKFSAILANSYDPLFGTPAADAMRRLSVKFFDTVNYVSQNEVEENDFRNVSPVYEEQEDPEAEPRLIGYQVTYSGPLQEQLFCDSGLDEAVNDELEALEEGVRNGLYPEGSIQRVHVDHIIDSLKLFQRREMITDPLSNEDLGWIPGVTADKKFADYVIKPKLAEKRIGEKGLVEYVFPKGFVQEDDPDRFFLPREDQKQRAKYTMEELQESAEKINLAGFNKAAKAYLASVREAENAAVMKDPDYDQEKIIRQNLLTNIRYLRQELQKARHADPTDKVALRMFGDKLSQMDGALFKDRSLTEDIENLNLFERYLAAGLPLAGFKEYKEYLNTLHNIKGNIDEIRENTTGLEGFLAAYDDLKTKLDTLPREGASAEARAAWRAGVKEAMQRFNAEYRAIDIDRIQFNEKTFPPIAETDSAKREAAVKEQNAEKTRWENKKDFIRDQMRTTVANRGVSAIDGYIATIDDLGKNTIKNRRDELDDIMADMVGDMDRMSKELKALTKKERDLPQNLRDSIDVVIKTGDSDNAASPENFRTALLNLQVEANLANKHDLVDWAKKNKAYFGNRMEQVKSKGVLLDESLNLQRTMNKREGRVRIDQALALFNTGRAKVFKNETKEHENARLAAEKFQTAKNELMALKGEKGSDKWKQKAEEVMGLANDVSRETMLYMKAKKMHANSWAGKDRLNGSIMLYREAEITRVMLKKEMAANERYAEIAQKTEQLNASISDDPAIVDQVAEANARKMTEEVKREIAREKRLQTEEKSMGKAMDAFGRTKKSISQDALSDKPAPKKAPEKKIKETSFEEMTRNLTFGEQKKEPVKRGNADIRQNVRGDVNNGPQIQGPGK